ncbi:nuclear transport factor 2 family protein [Mycolicibacterium austroafricanum]|uniref:Nuclear transport factor 2 family protein n=1 Tax=Mycolicibacterium austroafricanum TaxID=39687 RepID=A0ABT8HIB1_MYCAO|nr:nuclear transport factor 2 family protein [Mycolicibacterium austroafricanum]MDN4520510.1 nuclear transport factor 2 family protein [Mycolicibacterium austroafricanum]
MSSQAQTEKRVARLEDTVAIANTKMEFVRQIDTAINNGETLTTLPPSISDSAIMTIAAPLHATWTAQEGIAAMRHASFSLCFLGSEQIHLDEHDPDLAVGQWVSWHPMTLGGSAWLVAGRIRDEFARRNGRWQLTRIEFTPEICTPWQVGWGSQRLTGVIG